MRTCGGSVKNDPGYGTVPHHMTTKTENIPTANIKIHITKPINLTKTNNLIKEPLISKIPQNQNSDQKSYPAFSFF